MAFSPAVSPILAGMGVEASQPSVSIIVPTLDRRPSLMDLLHALRLQTYQNFEVVIVAGPCTDDTVACLVREFGQAVVIEQNPERNVSMSRNIGVSAARGDILAFLDDDEIPEATWLQDLLRPFESPTVGAVGGAVIGRTGRSLDWLYCSADRYGAAYIAVDRPTHLEWPDQDDPARRRTIYFPGGNFAVRRAAFESAGGFDESIVYYLDDTDLFFRLEAEGWELQQLESARIHHRVLAGIARDADDERTTNWSLVLRSRAYFASKHALPLVGPEKVTDEFDEFTSHIRPTLDTEGQAALDAQAKLCRRQISTSTPALTCGNHSHLKIRDLAAAIRRYPTTTSLASGHVVIVDDNGRGSSRCEVQGRRLGEFGHEVRIVRRGDSMRTTWEQGIWIHTIVCDADESAALVRDELQRISSNRAIDLVIGTHSLPPEVDHPYVNVPTLELSSTRPLGEPSLVARSIPSVARLSGGVGNEMFQYAAAISLSGRRRAYAIPQQNSQQVSIEQLLPGWTRFVGPWTTATLRRLGAISGTSSPLSPRTPSRIAQRTENQHGTLSGAVSGRQRGGRRPFVLDGYFQHPDWFEPGAQEVVSALIENAPDGWRVLREHSTFVIVSLRRRDFVQLGWALSDAYYSAALMLIDPQQPVVVVSDDPVAAARMRERIRSSGRTVIEPEPLSADRSISDFWLIAAGSDVVLSNSTFCWWATRVGDASAVPSSPRTVVCPSTWIPGTKSNLIDPHWYAVDVALGADA